MSNCTVAFSNSNFDSSKDLTYLGFSFVISYDLKYYDLL